MRALLLALALAAAGATLALPPAAACHPAQDPEVDLGVLYATASDCPIQACARVLTLLDECVRP